MKSIHPATKNLLTGKNIQPLEKPVVVLVNHITPNSYIDVVSACSGQRVQVSCALCVSPVSCCSVENVYLSALVPKDHMRRNSCLDITHNTPLLFLFLSTSYSKSRQFCAHISLILKDFLELLSIHQLCRSQPSRRSLVIDGTKLLMFSVSFFCIPSCQWDILLHAVLPLISPGRELSRFHPVSHSILLELTTILCFMQVVWMQEGSV